MYYFTQEHFLRAVKKVCRLNNIDFNNSMNYSAAQVYNDEKADKLEENATSAFYYTFLDKINAGHNRPFYSAITHVKKNCKKN